MTRPVHTYAIVDRDGSTVEKIVTTSREEALKIYAAWQHEPEANITVDYMGASAPRQYEPTLRLGEKKLVAVLAD